MDDHTSTSGRPAQGPIVQPAAGRALRTGSAVVRGSWLRFIVIVMALVVCTAVGVVVGLALISGIASAQTDIIAPDGVITTRGVVLLIVEMVVPALVLTALVTSATLAAVVTLADDLLAGRTPRSSTAVLRGIRRSPAVLGALTLSFVALAITVLATPLLVAAGLIGLALTPLARAARRRRRPTLRWPTTRTLAILAVPFAPVALMTVRWGLIVPTAALERVGPLRAMARSRELTAGRVRNLTLVLLAAMATYWPVQLAFGLVQESFGEHGLLTLARVASQVALMAIPLAVVTVAYREVAGTTPTERLVAVPVLRRAPQVTLTAVLVVISTVIGLTTFPGVATRPAAAESTQTHALLDDAIALDPEADPATPDDATDNTDTDNTDTDTDTDGSLDGEPDAVPDDEATKGPDGAAGVGPGAFTVNDPGDAVDADPVDGLCATATDTCTLRAAIDQANADGSVQYTIGFAVGGSIALATPLEISGQVAIDGVGNHVTITGAGQLVRTTATASYSLTNLTFSGGSTAGSGGALESFGYGTLANVTFTANQAAGTGGAVAVLGGYVWIFNGTFVDNSAPAGADVAVEGNGSASIDQSTFLGAPNSALHNGGSGGGLSVYTSIVGSNSLPACSGLVFSGVNVSNDPNCGDRGDLTGVGSLGDHGGWVPTVNLTAASPAVDGGTGEGCQGPDARGMARPQGWACDLGAFELEPGAVILPVDIDVTTTPNPSTWSGLFTIVATLTPGDGAPVGTIPGDITFRTADGVLGTAALVATANGSKAELTVDLDAGDYRIEAEFAGDAVFAAASGHIDHVVVAPRTEVRVRTDPMSTRFGAPVAVNVTVDAPDTTRNATGTVVVRINGAAHTTLTLVDGAASGMLAGLPAGTVTVAAAYPGDANYPGAAGSTTHEVTPTDAIVDLTATPEPTVFGQTVTMRASVAGVGTTVVPAGTVTFYDGAVELGSAPLANGVAVLSTALLPPGLRSLRVVYGGSAEVAAGDSTRAHQVDATATTIWLGTTPNPASIGQTVTVTANVAAVAPGAGTPQGTVGFYRAGALLERSTLNGSGMASASFSASVVGDVELRAVYEGSPAHRSGEATRTHATKAGLATIEVDGPASSSLGTDATFKVRVITPDGSLLVPSGGVGLWRGSQPLAFATLDITGRATLTTDLLPVGVHDLTVVYAGDGSHESISTIYAHTVTPAASVVTVTAATATIVAGVATTYTATVTGPASAGAATGTVTFSGLPGVADQTVTLEADGTADITVATSASGPVPHVLGASYSGDVDHEPGTGTLDVYVEAAELVLRVDAAATTVDVGDLLTLDIDVEGPTLGDDFDGTATIVVLVNGDRRHFFTIDGPGTTRVVFDTPQTVPFGASTITAELAAAANYRAEPSDGLAVSVVAARPVVTLTLAPSPATPGAAVTATIRVAGPSALVPTGTIEILDPTGVIATAAVTGTAGPGVGLATVTLPPFARGIHAVAARYIPSTPQLLRAESPIVEHRVVGIATEIHAVDDRPTVIGETITWTFQVISASRGAVQPAGSVVASIDGREVGRATVTPGPLAGWATAYVTVGALAVGTHRVSATFVPTDAHEPSSITFDHTVKAAEARIVVTAAATTLTWGEDLRIWARVEAVGSNPGTHPTGTITLDDGAGQTCTIDTNGSCVLRWATPGRFTITATYAGDDRYGPTTATPVTVEVTRRTPVLTASISSTRPESGQPVTLTWTLDGPTTGTVQASVIAGRPCAATALKGSCTETFDRSLSGRTLPAGVTYRGDLLWAPASWSTSVTSIGCFPLTLVAEPAEGGRLTASPGPNCGPANARGYLAGSAVWVTATPTTGGIGETWRLAELSPVSPDGDAVTTRIRIGADAGSHTLVKARFQADAVCATVVLRTRHVGMAQDTGGSLWPADAPNCPIDVAGNPITPRWTSVAGTVTGRVRLGTEVRTGITMTTPETTLYGYRWGSTASPITQRSAEAFVVAGDVDVTAAFGPRCYGVTAAAEGPGSVTIDTRANCASPSLTGWTRDTAVAFTAVPDGPHYLDRWTPDSVEGGPMERTCGGCGPDGADTLRYRSSIRVGGHPTEHVVAQFGHCYELDIQPRLHRGGKGTIDPDPSNCNSEPDGNWYRQGSQVLVIAEPTYPSQFGKWNDNDSDNGWRTVELTMDRDRQLRPSFVGLGGCHRVVVRAEDPAWTTVSASTADLDTDDVCHRGNLSDGPAQAMAGRFVGGQLGVHTESLQGNPLVGWEVGEDAGGGQDFEYPVGNDVTLTSVACVEIDAVVNIVGDDGTVVSGSPISAGLVGVSPAPDCPYHANAWRVGTTVSVGAVGEPMGYTFTGWGGEASGTAPDIELTLDGMVSSRHVELNYTQICHTLTLTHDAADVTVYPPPNCLGADPAARRYIGGSLVVLKGRVPGGKVWQGWVGDVVEKGKVNPAMVIMDGDRSAGHRWRSKDLDEKIVDGFEWFGDQAAIFGKKAVGVLSMMVAETLTGLPPGCVIFLLGAVGTALDLFLGAVGVDSDITQYFGYLQETLDFALAGLSCVGAWGMGGSKGSTEGEMLADGLEAGLDARYGSDLQDALASLEEAEAARTWTQTMDPQYRGFPKNVVVEESTGIVTRAKIKYSQYKVAKANYAAVVDAPALLGVGLSIYGISQGSGVSWDSSASDAWSDMSTYNECTRGLVPSYLEHTIDDDYQG